MSDTSQREIDALIAMLRENPFPEELSAAREAMDGLGAPVAEDVEVEEKQVGGVRCQMLTPAGADPEQVIIYFHGGAYVLGSLQSHAGMAAEIGKAAGCCVLQVDYRLAPENPFPAPLEDACSAYRGLLGEGYNAANLVLAGDSAGGGLVLATLSVLKNDGDALPRAAVCLSPWIDMEFTGDSVETCSELDPIIDMDIISGLAQAYLAGQAADNPLASPLHLDLQGFPPLLIQVGEREILLSDSQRLAEKAREARLDVVFELWPEMIHVWQLFYPDLAEGRSAIARIGEYIREQLD